MSNPPRMTHLTRRHGRALAIVGAVLVQALLLLPAYGLDWRTLRVRNYSIPSGGMKPTLLIGDYAFAITISKPERGDVVTYHLGDPLITYVERIIGLPGERVQMIGGVPNINGQPVKRERIEDFVDVGPQGRLTKVKRWHETLPNGVGYDTLDSVDDGRYDNTPVYTVPNGHFFMLGDNRDNSIDSRATSQHGTVPAANVTGRMAYIYFSIAEGESLWRVWRLPWTIRWGRLFSPVR